MLKLLLVAAIVAGVWYYLRRPAVVRVSGEAEARALLGVAADADAAEIRAAHRRLLAGVHPDRGGSADLTRRVNAARDLLLRGRG